MKQIIPSIIAKNQKELEKRIDKVDDYEKRIHLDVMDGIFVPNKSLNFDFQLPEEAKINKENARTGKLIYEAHLMISNPEEWIEKNHEKIDIVLVHIEAVKNKEKIIELARSKKLQIGFALRPETSIEEVKKYLNNIDLVLILDVTPGKYGGKLIPSALKKITKLRNLKPKFDIEVDGHVNPNTIKLMEKAGANLFVSGSALQKSEHIYQTITEMKEEIS